MIQHKPIIHSNAIQFDWKAQQNGIFKRHDNRKKRKKIIRSIIAAFILCNAMLGSYIFYSDNGRVQVSHYDEIISMSDYFTDLEFSDDQSILDENASMDELVELFFETQTEKEML